ncbi:phage major capsid protein [Ramlibacter sp. AW1]|uniref:Phage major capsid protein n=1 Tax=Ramlibacter aurantiacus TaxID=2801330 RepID=A0A937D3A1_9BURK|nr:phage major capsid protein [Ramlibacter aurantiacus]MBL0420515.1 phage major capsid protein [Ramlibacter aurantiacus]
MAKLAELRAERDQLIEQSSSITSQGKYSQTEAVKVESNLARVDKIDEEIRAIIGRAEEAGDELSTSESALKVLRTGKEIRAHYRKSGAAGVGSGEGLSFSAFVRGVAGMKTTPEVQAALSEGTDTAGGYAVPHVLMPGILEALVPASSLMQAGAGIVPVPGGKDFTTAGIDSIPTAAWRLESGSVTSSEPSFRAVVAAPKSLAFMFKVSRELLMDARNMDEALTTACAQAMAKELDRAGLRGSGTNPEPRGILNTSGINSVANGTNGESLATLGYVNFFSGVQAALNANAPAPTAAIMSPRSLVTLAALEDSTGQPLRVPRMLEGIRQIGTSQVPNNLTVGTSTDCTEIYLGDFSKMAFIMREQFSMMMLKELYAGTGEIGFVCHARADVALWYAKAFTVITGLRA